jgi:hypothetical protein
VKYSTTAVVALCIYLAGADHASGAIFQTDFNSGLPDGSALYGTAAIDATGGVGNTGKLRLTRSGFQNQQGAINDFSASQAIAGFDATFSVLFTSDGFSFNLANDIPNNHFGEEGVGSGLTVSFDGISGAGIDVRVGGVDIGRVAFDPKTSNYKATHIHLDQDGTLDVIYGTTTIFSNLATGFGPITNGRFGIGARAGGVSGNQFVDNLRIETFEASDPVPEPAALTLWSLGILGCALARYRRSRKH